MWSIDWGSNRRYTQQGRLVSFFQHCDGQSRLPLCFCQLSFHEPSTSSRLVYLGEMNRIVEPCEKRLSTIQIIVSFASPIDLQIEHRQIVLNAGLVSRVSCLLEIKTRCCVFHSCGIKIIGAVLNRSKIFEHYGELVM